jgi:hypothetical protein
MTEIKDGNPGLTLIMLVLDDSSSMHPSRGAVIRGVDKLLEEQRNNGHDELLVGFVTFGWHARAFPILPIDKLPRLGSAAMPYDCPGLTALRDGLGEAIAQARSYCDSQPPHRKPGRVLIFVQTDGGENNSSQWSPPRLQDDVRKALAKGWEFLYIGESKGAVGALDAGRPPSRIYLDQPRSMLMQRRLWYSVLQTEDMIAAISLASIALRTGHDFPDGDYTVKSMRALMQQEGVLTL